MGRRVELAALVAGVTSPPSMVFVEGEVGVGKTRLVTELGGLPATRGLRLLVGHCHEVGEPFPLAPILDALSSVGSIPGLGGRGIAGTGELLGCLRPYLPELAAWLPPAPADLADPRAERHRLLRAVLELLDRLGPLVLVLEDAHWLDEATQELLRLLRVAWPRGLGLVLTFRGEDLPPASAVRFLIARGAPDVATRHLALEPFTAEEVRAFVGSALDRDDVSDEFATFLHDHTAGIPFALEEMLLLLRDRQDLVHRSGSWVGRKLQDLSVPLGLQSFVLARLGRLGPAGGRVVEAAAVLERLATEDVLRTVTELEDRAFEAGLTAAVRSSLLREGDGGFGFRHVLAREAVYRAIPGSKRRRLHGTAARAIERARPDALAQLARHFRVAGDAAAWRRYAEEAADRAVALGDHFGAARLLRDLPREAGLRGEARVRVVQKLVRAAVIGLAHRESIRVVQEAVGDAALSRESRGKLRYELGRLLHQSGDATSAYREWLLAAEELPDGCIEEVHALSSLASPCVTGYGVGDHLRWLTEAHARMTTLAAPGDRAYCLVDRAATLAYTGDPSAWRAVEELPWEASDPAVKNQLLRASFNLATALLPLGHDERAAALVGEGERRLGGTDGPRFTRFTDIFHLLLDWRAGRWPGLEARAAVICEEREELHVASIAADLVLGVLLLARGESGAGREVLGRLIGAALPAGWIPGAAAAAAEMAIVDAETGHAELGWRSASPVLRILESKGIWVWGSELVPSAVRLLLDLERRGDAGALVDRFAAGIEGRDAPAAAAALHSCMALLTEEAEPTRAAGAHRAAAAAWERIGRPFEVARSLEAAGRCLLPARSPARSEDALKLLRLATNTYLDLGASWYAARARRVLRMHGAAAPHRRGRRGYGDELSPREREVAELLSRGRSNREIAEALFVSVKAVEKHVSSILRKLRAGSRAEVAAALAAVRNKSRGVPQ